MKYVSRFHIPWFFCVAFVSFLWGCGGGMKSFEVLERLEPIDDLPQPKNDDNFVVQINNVADNGTSYSNRVELLVNGQRIRQHDDSDGYRKDYRFHLRLRNGIYKVKAIYYAKVGHGEKTYEITTTDGKVRIYPNRRTTLSISLEKRLDGRLLKGRNHFTETYQAMHDIDSETNGSLVNEFGSVSTSKIDLTGFDPALFIGREVAIPDHLEDGEEFDIPLRALIEYGKTLFMAVWTVQEGGGRPLSKGTGEPLSDASAPLVFPRNFNRISAPDANSCAGCHNAPFGIPGGGGDIVGNVFVHGQRFDFANFDHADRIPTKGAVNERGDFVTLETIANSRATLGMFGSGFIEMLARQMTRDLQAIRDATSPGRQSQLTSKGVSFGVIARNSDGTWDVSEVEGIPAESLVAIDPQGKPSLIIRPFHQSGDVVSLREFSNNAFNHHHGIQSTERFGTSTDPDGDTFVNEMTRADVTAVTIFQATMAVPGRVIPNDPLIEKAVQIGEQMFQEIGCATCHVPSLPLDDEGWIFTEPNPFNPTGNLQPGKTRSLQVDLTSDELPGPRLKAVNGIVQVPAFTDLKLHDITCGADDPNREPLDMAQPSGSEGFFAGNAQFLTRKLWGVANEPPFFHHGKFTTLREAIFAHCGEALASREAFVTLDVFQQNSIIEFLKSLQVLPPGTKHLIVDEHGGKKPWPTRSQ